MQQLGDDQFTKREAADRQLREAGRVIVSYFQQLDTSCLDAEQRFRIRRIINSLTAANGDDMPEQVASLLLGDDAIWLGCLPAPRSRPARPPRDGSGRFGAGRWPSTRPRTRQTRKKQIEATEGEMMNDECGMMNGEKCDSIPRSSSIIYPSSMTSTPSSIAFDFAEEFAGDFLAGHEDAAESRAGSGGTQTMFFSGL